MSKPSMLGEGENHGHKPVEYSTIFWKWLQWRYCFTMEKKRKKRWEKSFHLVLKSVSCIYLLLIEFFIIFLMGKVFPSLDKMGPHAFGASLTSVLVLHATMLPQQVGLPKTCSMYVTVMVHDWSCYHFHPLSWTYGSQLMATCLLCLEHVVMADWLIIKQIQYAPLLGWWPYKSYLYLIVVLFE